MKRRSLLTFVDRDIRLRRPTDKDRDRNDQITFECLLLVDSKTDEIVGLMHRDALFDQDGNFFTD